VILASHISFIAILMVLFEQIIRAYVSIDLSERDSGEKTA